MLRNYIHIISRFLVKNKLFSFINIFGLSLAIACAILVIMFVQNELSYDRFLPKADRIYRPYTYAKAGDREATNVYTPFIMGKQLRDNFPEITAYTLLASFNNQVKIEDRIFTEQIHIASKDFFRIFDFEVLSGATTQALEEPGNIVLTEEMALKYFGRKDVVGERMGIMIGGEEKDFNVKAVLSELPPNSSIRFRLMISEHHLDDIFPEPMMTSWHMITGETYLLLREGADPEAVQSKFPSLVEQVLAEDLERMDFYIYLQPLTDIHLNTELPAGDVPVSDPKYIFILLAIATLILAIAAINFIMLSLGQSFRRAKEIGIRKSSGASRRQIMFQFLSESVIMALIGLLAGIGLVYLLLPWFNELSGQHLSLELQPENLLIFISLTCITGILAGIYPALVVSGFKPVRILRGNLKVGQGSNTLGSVLVTGQFILFVILIGCTLIMKNQMAYIQNKNLGFDKENVLVVPVSVNGAKGARDAIKKGFESGTRLDNAVRNLPEVVSAGMGSHTFEPGTWTNIGYRDENNTSRNFYYNTVGPDYIPTLGINMVRGRNFDPANPADRKRSIIVNEAFVKAFDLDDPIGSGIPAGQFEDHEIIGVVQNFHIHSLHTEIQPLVLAMNVDLIFSGANNINIGSSVQPKLFIRLKENEVSKGIKAVQNGWSGVFPGEPFDYRFLEQGLKEQYEKERNLGKIVTGSSVLAVIIGCLGLFGLSILAFNSRVKEISIRKVLGAPVFHILMVLSKRFILLLILALVLAIPVIYQVMQQWLEGFEYRITIRPWVFVLTGLISLVIISISLSYQGISAIRTNPADTLRNE